MNREEIVKTLTATGQICEIEQITANGRPLRSWKHAPASMASVVESSRQYGDRDFIVFQDRRLTYAEHYRRVAALAEKLMTEFGVRKGDRVAIAMRNFPEWVVAFWAASSIGAIVVPLNAWWTSRELEYGLSDSGAVVAFVDQERLARILQIKAKLPLRHLFAAQCTGLPAGVTDLGSCFADVPEDIALPKVPLLPDDDATLFYTSGTTGFPKGTLGTHRNFCSVVGSMTFHSARTLLTLGGRVEDLSLLQQMPQAALLTVPLFHVTGCHGIMLTTMTGGGKLVFMHKWDPDRALDVIEQEKITNLTGVPAMVWQLLNHPDIARRDISSLRQIGYGGAPAPPELLRIIRARAPNAMVANGWGITETSSIVSGILGEDYVNRPDSVGHPMAICDVKVVDPGGKEMPPGEMGELWVRGSNVARGYWNKPEASAQSFTDGWFHTGDVGKVDEEGFIYVLDRLKDMIIRGGENVYCAEVEAALVEMPEVDAACVFGIPDEALGEEVGAAVVVRPGVELGEQELRDFAVARLARFKVPRHIWLRTEPLPVGATGKVQKKELKAFYTELLRRGGS